MTKTKTTLANTGHKTSKRSALIAKCSAPFVSKPRSSVEQEIRLDEPFRQWYPGDLIKGSIHLSFPKPVCITHLVIRLHGFVKVISNAKIPGETITYDESLLAAKRGIGRRGTEYFGNGFARLFEDECVLCGEGGVAGTYEFRFELALPSKDVPSSVDFEHGTISYLLTSILTRPTPVSSTSTCHRKLSVVESIDIGHIPRPRSHTVLLEAISKKRKSKVAAKKKALPTWEGATSDSSRRNSVNGVENRASVGPQTTEEPPRSPAPSEISSASVTSSTTSSNQTSSGIMPMNTVNGSSEHANGILTASNIISATTELLQGGCLAGDILPLRISVKHTKAIKSMQGIIVTLYRQGRIDTHPALPLGPQRKGEKKEYEDYYPKSRTGLGGLSLSSAGSSRTFRQDLAQIMPPLIVDPQSLTAVINTSIQAPLDLFPTIKCVPGTMVGFKYFVEVVIDLRGKLGGQDRIRSHLSMTSALQHGYGDPKLSRIDGADGVSFSSAPGFNYLITDQLRRMKGVVYTQTEVVVGTQDSVQRRGKARKTRQTVEEDTLFRSPDILGTEQHDTLDQEHRESRTGTHGNDQHSLYSIDYPQRDLIPPPEIEEELDEKARLRIAEENLLPSAPPQDDEPSSSLAPMPSAPPATDEDDFIRRYGLRAPAPAYDGPPASSPETIVPAVTLQGLRNLDLNCQNLDVIRATAGPEDDKQELERHRLLTLVSSPDEDDIDDEPESAAPGILAPTAPVLYQDDLFDIHDSRVPQQPLGPVPRGEGDEEKIERQCLRTRTSSPKDPNHGDEPTAAEQSHEPDSRAPVTNEYDHGMSAPVSPRNNDNDIQASHASVDDNNSDLNETLPVYER